MITYEEKAFQLFLHFVGRLPSSMLLDSNIEENAKACARDAYRLTDVFMNMRPEKEPHGVTLFDWKKERGTKDMFSASINDTYLLMVSPWEKENGDLVKGHWFMSFSVSGTELLEADIKADSANDAMLEAEARVRVHLKSLLEGA